MYELKGSIEFKKQDKIGEVKVIDINALGDREFEVTGN